MHFNGGTTPSPQMALPLGDLITQPPNTIGPPECTNQTAYRPLQPFLCRVVSNIETDRHTDRPRYMCLKRSHLCTPCTRCGVKTTPRRCLCCSHDGQNHFESSPDSLNECQVAANPWTKPTDLGRESAAAIRINVAIFYYYPVNKIILISPSPGGRKAESTSRRYK